MPPKGKCWSCGEDTLWLTGVLLQHDIDGHWEYHMVCPICKKYFMMKGAARDVKAD